MRNKTLVIGVGNPILGDDGVGIHVVGRLRENPVEGVDYRNESLSGLELVDSLRGYERVLIVDAVKTVGGKPGDVYRLTPEDIPTLHGISPHDLDFRTALELERRLGPMPGKIEIYGIEVENVTEFTEELSTAVGDSIPSVVEMITEDIINASDL